MLRLIKPTEFEKLLELYVHLHEKEVPEITDNIKSLWEQICNDNNYNIIVIEEDGKLVSSCVCVVIPNFTRGVRPYALIENVVTHKKYRGKGYATACLDFAREIAKRNNCYKMMLLTGSKNPSTLAFYERAGYNCNDKTAFIQWL